MNFNKVYIIAEMSANHCGDYHLARKFIEIAKEIGCDAIKTQTYTADTITINSHNNYFKLPEKSLWKGKYLYDLYQEASMPWEWQRNLKEYADEVGIDFFSTPFDYTAIDFLETIGVSRYKIASFESFDFPLIRYAASKCKPIIISTGISTVEEIQEAIHTCQSVGNNQISLLKCTSEYPASLDSMNILTIQDMIHKFGGQGVQIGLSDHSMCVETVIAAVALGARIVEKHIMLTDNSVDSGFSLTVDMFSEMVQSIRRTEKCLGSVDYTINTESRALGRSLFVVKDIKKGEIFTNQNIRSIRPAAGLHPRHYNHILGNYAAKDLSFGTPLTWDDVLL